MLKKLAAEAFGTFAGPIIGASMNPARSLGPAVASARLADLWIYLLAPRSRARRRCPRPGL